MKHRPDLELQIAVFVVFAFTCAMFTWTLLL